MPAEIVTGRFCADYFSVFRVVGSRGDEYRVTFTGTQASCTCKAYEFFRGEESDRTCKHIAEVWKTGCFWNEQWYRGGTRELRPASYTGFPTLDGESCPACGGDVVPMKIAV